MSRLRRVRITSPPSGRGAAVSYSRSALATFSDGMRKLVIEDLRPGVVHVGDLPGPTRVLAWIGFLLLFAGVGLLFFNEPLRAAFPLLPVIGGTPGRGELVPYVLIPLTIFAFSLAWSFMLTGALRTRRIVKLSVLLLYLTLAAVWTAGTAQGILAAVLSWGALLCVPVFFLLRSRSKEAPALEFGVLLVLVSLTFGTSQIYAIGAWRTSGIPGVLANVPTMVYTFDLLVIPLLLYLGYILFSIAVLNWSLATHDILQVDFFTGQAALGGFGLFGKPLIYAIFAVILAELATDAKVAEEGEPDPQPAAS